MQCEKHRCELKIKWYSEGTPYCDFDGYYCPECERETCFNSEKREVAELEREIHRRIRFGEFFVERAKMNGQDVNDAWEGVLRKFF